jgi:RNA polymerase sigma factor (sigma-70 family)
MYTTISLIKEQVTKFNIVLSQTEIAESSQTIKKALARLQQLGYKNSFKKVPTEIISNDDILRRGLQARHQLFLANQALVLFQVPKYYKGKDLAGAIQEGFIGLTRACELYDSDTGYKFSTYATFWIRQSIASATLQEATSFKINPTLNYLKIRIRNTIDDHLKRFNEYPTTLELAELLNVSHNKIASALAIPYEVSLHEKASQSSDTDGEKIDFLANPEYEDYDVADKNPMDITDPFLAIVFADILAKLVREIPLDDLEQRQIAEAIRKKLI